MAITRFTDSYCTIELAKDFAGNADGVEYNAILRSIIRASSRFVETYTNQYWGPSAYCAGEVLPKIVGNFNDQVYLRWAPVLRIDSLSDDIQTYILNQDFFIDYETGKINLNSYTVEGTPESFSGTPFSLIASYAVGQGTPTTSSNPNDKFGGIAAPEDVQIAVAMIAGSLVQYGDRGDIRQRTKANESITFQDAAIPVKAKWLLEQHRRFV